MTEEYDLFISYVDHDHAWVEGYLLDALQVANVKYLSESSFKLGVPRIQNFQESIKQSRRTLLIISPAYLAEDISEFVNLIGQHYGQETGTWPVIPLILEATQLPPRLAMLQTLKATTSEEREIAITRLLQDLQYPVPNTIYKPPCPYPGMVPFSEKEQDRFFGRDQKIDELVERLRTHPFIAVIGPSGSGKSSLVFAGLIPQLKKSGLFGEGEWLILSMRPGESPLQTLKDLLKSDLSNPAQTITELLSTEPGYQRILLIIDQLEELFTQGKESEAFQKIILQLIEIPKLYTVFTARADFYADLMNSALWRIIQRSRIEVVPLDETGLRQAILKPAEGANVFIEPSLIEKLIDDSAEQLGILPLIQETLVLLWEKLERRFLPLRAYEALVMTTNSYGVKPQNGLQVAIARRADGALASLNIDPDKQYNIAQRIFIRLIQFGEGRADTRRQQLVSDLQGNNVETELFSKTLEHLINRRLLTSSNYQDNITLKNLKKIDIAHEALISGWPKLQDWIKEYRELELTRRRLMEKAKDWERLGRKKGGLLDEVELLESERWLSNAKKDINFTFDVLLANFIDASKSEINKRKQLNKIVIGTISVLGILATFSSIFAWRQLLETNKKNNELERTNIILDVGSQSFNLDAIISSINAGKKIKDNPALRTKDVAVADKIFDTLQNTLNLDSENKNLFAEYNRITGENKFIYSLNFHPRDDLIITTGSNKKAVIHNLKTKEKILELDSEYKNFNRAIFSNKGLIIGTVGEDKMVKLWDTKTGNLLQSLSHKDLEEVSNIAFSLDDQQIFSVSKDGKFRRWNVATGKLDKEILYPVGLRSISINPKDQSIAIGTYNNKIKILDKESKILQPDLTGHNRPIETLTFSPNGQILASASNDGRIKLWKRNNNNWQIIENIKGHESIIRTIKFRYDNQKIITASKDQNIYIWDTKGNKLQSFNSNSDISGGSFNDNGTIIAFPNSWSYEGMGINLWKSRDKIRNILGPTSEIININFYGLKNNFISSLTQNSDVKIWNKGKINDWQVNQEFSKNWEVFRKKYCEDQNNKCEEFKDKKNYPDGFGVKVFHFIPQENLHVSNINNKIYLWDIKGNQVDTFDAKEENHTKLIRSISISSDGKHLVSGSFDNTVKLWDVEKRVLIRTLGKNSKDGHNKKIINVQFSPNNEIIASTSMDGYAILWNLNGEILAKLDHYTKEIDQKTKKRKTIMVTNISFSPNSKQVVTSTNNGIVRLWNVKGKLEKEFSKQKESIWAIKFSPDGKVIVIATQDNDKNKQVNDRNVRIFDLQGNLLQTLYVGDHSVNSLSFSPDGKSLAAGIGTGVMVWRYWKLEDLLEYACKWAEDYFIFNADIDPKVKEAQLACQEFAKEPNWLSHK